MRKSFAVMVPSSLFWARFLGIMLFSRISRIKSGYQVWSSDTAQALLDTPSFLRLVPEEVLSLGQLFLLALCTEDGLQRVWVIASVPGFRRVGHWRGGEILNLFQMEVKVLGDDSQFGHVLFTASRMAADEVGDNLLIEILFTVDAVELALELIELLERGLAH